MKQLTKIEGLLIKLINIESISGNESAVARFIETQLTDFKLKRQYIDKSRFNIVAKKGESNVWLVAHMDTVPPFFKAKVENGKIFGRGAIDNKGNIAGIISASQKLKNINILFTVGEEKDFIGAKNTTIKDTAIIFEPTKFKIRTSQCGVITAKLTAKGDQKHSSLISKESDNAIHVIAKTLNYLIKQNWNCFNAGVIKGGIAPNIAAGSAEVDFSVRPRNQIEFVKILKATRALKGVKVEVINKMPPTKSLLSKNYPETEPVYFFSELFFFKKGLLFGVGDIANAHTLTEFVNRKDLNILPNKILAIVKSLEIN